MPDLVISYSRQDRSLIRAVAGLLQAALPGIDRSVYWDDAFQAGKPWWEQYTEAVEGSPQLFVFWCDHASRSTEVRREYEYAFEKHKVVVPVLLDATPLSERLALIHGVDLRGVVWHEGRRKPGDRGGMAELTDQERIDQSREPDRLLPYSYLKLPLAGGSSLSGPSLLEVHSKLAQAFVLFFGPVGNISFV